MSELPTSPPEITPASSTTYSYKSDNPIIPGLREADLYVPGFLTLLSTTPAVIVYIVVIVGESQEILVPDWLIISHVT